MFTLKQFLTEGVWSAPNTEAKARKLKALMKNPLPARDAGSKLYHLMGDDMLFDAIDEVVRKDDPQDDVRAIVKNHIKSLLKDFNTEDWRYEWDPQALRILQTI